MTDQAAARRNMVESQLKPNRVTDARILDAMGAVPRERFVPAHLSGVAYVDEDIEVAPGRHLLEPRVLGRMLQEAAVKPGERVLVVGAASGYDAAVLAEMGASVVAVECDGELAAAARANLSGIGVAGAEILEGDLAAGAARLGPYDLVLVPGAVPDVPPAIAAQLSDRGRVVAILGEGPVNVATLFSRGPSGLAGRALFDCGAPALPGFAREPGFVF